MKNNERLIQYFDIQLYGRTRAKGINHSLVSPRSLDKLMNEFSLLRELNLARKKVSSKSKMEFRLEDMEEKENCWLLLVNMVDGDAAHPVTQKIGGTGEDREVIDLGEDRGLESSTHLVLYKNHDEAGKHLALYERNSNIPFVKVVSFLNHLMKLAARQFKDKYIRPHPNGVDGKTINVYCVGVFLGHPSDEFKMELETGVLSGIRITSDVDIVRGYDANAHPELYSTEIKMKVGRIDVGLSGGNWKHLQKAIQYADSLNAPFVRIQFTDESGSSHSATVSTDTGHLWNAEKYVKKRKVEGFGRSLKTAFPIIHNGIAQKMMALVQ